MKKQSNNCITLAGDWYLEKDRYNWILMKANHKLTKKGEPAPDEEHGYYPTLDHALRGYSEKVLETEMEEGHLQCLQDVLTCLQEIRCELMGRRKELYAGRKL